MNTANGITRKTRSFFLSLLQLQRCVRKGEPPKTRRVWTHLIETELELSDHRAAALAYYYYYYYYLYRRFLSPLFLSPGPPSLCLSSSLFSMYGK